MDFIERNDQFSENLMLADDQGNRITYGEFEKIYEERSKFLEEGRLAFLYCRNHRRSSSFITGAVLGIMWFLCF